MKKAVILLSGGLDSAVALAIALKEEREVFPLFVDYEQPNLQKEQRAVYRLTHEMHVRSPQVMRIRGLFGGYTTQDCYVPGRNTVLLSLAASFVEQIEGEEIWIGLAATATARVVKRGRGKWAVSPVTFFPDCCESYLTQMQAVLRKGAKALRGLQLVAPIIDLNKAAILQKAQELELRVEHTWSCYYAEETPCGACPACRVRSNAFFQLKHLTDDTGGDLGIIEEGESSQPVKGEI